MTKMKIGKDLLREWSDQEIQQTREHVVLILENWESVGPHTQAWAKSAAIALATIDKLKENAENIAAPNKSLEYTTLADFVPFTQEEEMEKELKSKTQQLLSTSRTNQELNKKNEEQAHQLKQLGYTNACLRNDLDKALLASRDNTATVDELLRTVEEDAQEIEEYKNSQRILEERIQQQSDAILKLEKALFEPDIPHVREILDQDRYETLAEAAERCVNQRREYGESIEEIRHDLRYVNRDLTNAQNMLKKIFPTD